MPDETGEPTEEELRAALAEQMRHVRVEDVILQTVATLVNLGAGRLGLTGDAEVERDLGQARLAIDGARALVPLCPEDQQSAIRQALSQLQIAFAREAPPGPAAAGGEPGSPAADDAAKQADDDAERAKARSKIWTPPGT